MQHFLRPYPKRNARLLYRCAVAAGMVLSMAVAHAQTRPLSEVFSSSSMFLLHSRAQGFLGVDVGDIDQERAQALHLKDWHGAEITVLDHDAPAGKVGLKLHDVILRVNGENVISAEQMKEILHDAPPGRKLQLVVSRDGAQQTITVQLADKRKVQQEARERLDSLGTTTAAGNSFVSNGGDIQGPGSLHGSIFGSSMHVGAIVEPLTAQMADFLGVSGGVMIKTVARKSAADLAGLRAHDVILEVGGEAVVTSSDWERLLRTAEGKPVQVEIFRDRMKQLVLLNVDAKYHKP